MSSLRKITSRALRIDAARSPYRAVYSRCQSARAMRMIFPAVMGVVVVVVVAVCLTNIHIVILSDLEIHGCPIHLSNYSKYLAKHSHNILLSSLSLSYCTSPFSLQSAKPAVRLLSSAWLLETDFDSPVPRRRLVAPPT